MLHNQCIIVLYEVNIEKIIDFRESEFYESEHQ